MAYDINRLAALPLPEPAASTEARTDLRLSLAPGLARLGALDGGWWPRSRDAATELPELVAYLTGPLGMVARLAVDVQDWDGVPRRIKVGDRRVKVGWFPNLDHIIIVTRSRQDQFLLLVVPPEATADKAEAALRRAAAGAGGAQPREILAECGISTARTPATLDDPGPKGETPRLRLVPDEPVEQPPALTAGEGGATDEPPAQLGRWLDDGAPEYAADR